MSSDPKLLIFGLSSEATPQQVRDLLAGSCGVPPGHCTGMQIDLLPMPRLEGGQFALMHFDAWPRQRVKQISLNFNDRYEDRALWSWVPVMAWS